MKKLYIVYVHITPDGMHYYGISNNHKCRWEYNGIHYRDTSLQPYIEKYGWENIQHKVLFENLSYDDALKIEDSLILSGWEKGNCINKRRSGNVSKDVDYIREYQREYHREYQRKNIEKILEYQRKNRDKILEYQREYYQKNRDKKLEQNRKYKQRQKEEKQLKELGYIPLF